ncbi:divalent-cation tolerance protein CutA [Ornithinimicrobium sp. Y1847]|uniref:divalent-cation tolerance protein CutA n=1 Tax=Ornithinimicrobium sp. Y1847 TaxID=3405419 RepID=UPI003B6715AE
MNEHEMNEPGTDQPGTNGTAAPEGTRPIQSALIEAHISVPDAETAQRIAGDLTARQLSACAQILGPMTSYYTWKGEVQRSQEWLLLVKTTEAAFPEVASTVRQQHRYDVPEIIAVPITHALSEYGDWVRKHSDGITDDEVQNADA